MTLRERLEQLAAALPSDGASVTLNRAALLTLLSLDACEVATGPRDLTVEEVATATGRASSTVRGWLLAGDLPGYKLNGRDWRVRRSALRTYVGDQRHLPNQLGTRQDNEDISAWRRI